MHSISCGVDYINTARFEVSEKKLREGELDGFKARKLGDVRTKMKLGRKLSYDEKVFLKLHSSDLYEKAKKIEEERDEFRRALANCKTKGEARRTQVTKSMELQMETENKSDLEFITTRMMRMMGILDEFSNFAKSKEYGGLPN
ncbi:MAG: hypothetical protein FWF67_04700 [Fibromonadales bacterium]|nr:hypothetical protein [Fibromonadales bacterium]